LNNPSRFVDPSGHAYCDFINNQNGEDCKGGQWRISSSKFGDTPGGLIGLYKNFNNIEQLSDVTSSAHQELASAIESYMKAHPDYSPQKRHLAA
jgi:hypothetical protein